MLLELKDVEVVMHVSRKIVWDALATSWAGLLIGIVVIMSLRSMMAIDRWARHRWQMLAMTAVFAAMPLIWWVSGASQLALVTVFSSVMAALYAWMYGYATAVHAQLVADRESSSTAT